MLSIYDLEDEAARKMLRLELTIYRAICKWANASLAVCANDHPEDGR